MNGEQVIVLVDAEGNVTIQMRGFRGKACLATTEELLADLGTVVSHKATSDMSLAPVATQTRIEVKR